MVAANLHLQLIHLIGLILGTGLLIASACVFNNYLDISIDQKMQRTAQRELVTGLIKAKNAIIFALILLIISLCILLILTNLSVFLLGLVSFIFYVIIYGYFKRHSIYGTLIGTIPGAASLAAGYLVKNNHLSLILFLLVLIMIVWQLAHFYAISIYRYDDYKQANLPVWSVVKGLNKTKNQILINQVLLVVLSLVFVVSSGRLKFFGLIFGIVTLSWLIYGLRLLNKMKLKLWAQKIFVSSLVVNLIFIFLLIFNFLIK
jgi:protoheme IX farnesyltransferase